MYMLLLLRLLLGVVLLACFAAVGVGRRRRDGARTASLLARLVRRLVDVLPLVEKRASGARLRQAVLARRIARVATRTAGASAAARLTVLAEGARRSASSRRRAWLAAVRTAIGILCRHTALFDYVLHRLPLGHQRLGGALDLLVDATTRCV